MEIKFGNGSLEALKWIALTLMLGDHINKYLFNGTLPRLFELGRVVMPIFVFVLVYNLMRPTTKTHAQMRTLYRMLLFGSAASIPYMMLGGLINEWYPLNILFTLAVITGVFILAAKKKWDSYCYAAVLGIAGGAIVEFWWFPIVLAIGVALILRQHESMRLTILGVILIMVSLALEGIYINSNQWALAAIPLIGLFSLFDAKVPRLKWVFYIFYPAHLVALLLIRIPMAKAGYWFVT